MHQSCFDMWNRQEFRPASRIGVIGQWKEFRRVAAVEPLGQAELLVRFENGVDKIYDCRPLLDRPQFGLLANISASSATFELI